MDTNDAKIIEYLVNYSENCFNAGLRWLNCILHNSGMQEFGNSDDLANALKSDDEFLTIFCLIYSFERQGFDAKLDKCKKNCSWYKDGNKIKSHPVAVLSALNEIKREYDVETFQELIEIKDNFELTEEVFSKAKEIHLKVLGKPKFNEKGFNAKHMQSYFEFLERGYPKDLRKYILENKLHKAYESLQTLGGVGSKVARFIIRDLIYALTDWGLKKEFPAIKGHIGSLTYAMPIDIWVRRISLAIPTVCDEVKRRSSKKLDCENIMDDQSIDDDLMHIVVEICYKLGLNPLRYNSGAFCFGVTDVKQKRNLKGIYNLLKHKVNTEM